MDLSEFEALGGPRRASCQVGLALATLSETETAQLSAALEERVRIGDGAIAKWLGRRDMSVSVSAVTHHRNGTCRCDR